ncbi:MAG: gamma-glutamylcyclotransferase [Rhizobiaceae bacterium]|nr:gamma-glutamylcyclotransferase [Rhizobiaceae bacterium]
MSAASAATEPLFSYGTLRLPAVQRANFGRLLEGRPDTLPGYALASILIDDPDVVSTSGLAEHLIAQPTGNPADEVAGHLLWLTPQELEAADRYEVDDYRRVKARLGSGVDAFVYVDARFP